MKRRKARATFAAYITIKGLGGFQEKFISRAYNKRYSDI